MSHPAWQCKRNVPMTEAVVAVSKAQGEEPRCVLSSVTLNKHCLHGAAPMFSLESEHTWSTRKSWLFLFGVISHSLTLFLFSSFRLREWERERGGRLRAWDRRKRKKEGEGKRTRWYTSAKNTSLCHFSTLGMCTHFYGAWPHIFHSGTFTCCGNQWHRINM